MNLEELAAFNLNFHNCRLKRIDTAMALVALEGFRKKTGSNWGPGTYVDFDKAFPWGSLAKSEGKAYLGQTLEELSANDCLSFEKLQGGAFSVELAALPEGFQYFEKISTPRLLDWITKLQSVEEIALYLVSASSFLEQKGPVELTASSLANDFGFWRGKSRAKYLPRQFKKLVEVDLLEVDFTRAYTIVGVNELPAPSGDFEPSSYIHPTHDRPPFPARLRKSIFQQDGGLCSYCGTTLREEDPFQIDHIIPLYLNGARLDPRNLATACQKCNGSRNRFPTGEQSGKDIWRQEEPGYWRKGKVDSIGEATITENGATRRIPIIAIVEEE